MRRVSQQYGFLLVTWLVLVTMLVVAFELVRDPPLRPARTFTPARLPTGLAILGEASRRPVAVPAAAEGLVRVWSFEQGLAGWRAVGPAEPGVVGGGRHDGSAASVRRASPAVAAVGLELPRAVVAARPGRYVVSASVRASAQDLRVALSLVSGGGRSEVARREVRTPPAMRWRDVAVEQTVAHQGGVLGVRIVALELPPGEVLMIDQVTLRQA